MTSTKGLSSFDENSTEVKNDALVSSQYCLFLVCNLKRVESLIWARTLILFYVIEVHKTSLYSYVIEGQTKMRLHR